MFHVPSSRAPFVFPTNSNQIITGRLNASFQQHPSYELIRSTPFNDSDMTTPLTMIFQENNGHMIYLMFAMGFFLGFTCIVGVIIFVTRNRSRRMKVHHQDQDFIDNVYSPSEEMEYQDEQVKF